MSLNLVKLCVGCESIADLEGWIAEKEARAIAGQPEIVFFDEPTTGLHLSDVARLEAKVAELT